MGRRTDTKDLGDLEKTANKLFSAQSVEEAEHILDSLHQNGTSTK